MEESSCTHIDELVVAWMAVTERAYVNLGITTAFITYRICFIVMRLYSACIQGV
jgi:hypothetical protein